MEKWAGIFNAECFSSELKPVAITLQPAGPRRRLLGWYCAQRWRNEVRAVDEINVCAETLKRPAEEILETLLHEMCHQKNMHDGVQGVSPNSQYHNGRFRAEAERVGLICSYQQGVRWGITSLGPGALRVIRRHKVNRRVFSIARLADPGPTQKPPSRWHKWVCSCGPIRVPRVEFAAVCEICGSDFEKSGG